MSTQLSLTQRPHLFSEFYGQASIIKEMKNRSTTMTFPQVMLFSGPVGTGKTTLAFIIAMLINSEIPIKTQDKDGTIYFEPDLESNSSKAVLNESFGRNIELIDGAFFKKNDIQELENRLSTRPLYDKNRVIILDEIQEIAEATKFQSLLKVIERQRHHVTFILTTMNESKFDNSLFTRCQHYRLKLLNDIEIIQYLKQVMISTGNVSKVPTSFITEGFPLLAKYSEGSARQAVQNLERCLYGELYTPEQITTEFESTSSEKMITLLKMLLDGDSSFGVAMEGVGTEDFFYKSYTTLVSYQRYKLSGYVDQDWKKKSYDSITPRPTLVSKLLNVYNEIKEHNYYWNETYFWSKILGFMAESQFTSMPTRQVRG